jgi:hypothetical protein
LLTANGGAASEIDQKAAEDRKPAFDLSRITTKGNMEAGDTKWRMQFYMKDKEDVTKPEKLISAW